MRRKMLVAAVAVWVSSAAFAQEKVKPLPPPPVPAKAAPAHLPLAQKIKHKRMKAVQPAKPLIPPAPVRKEEQ